MSVGEIVTYGRDNTSDGIKCTILKIGSKVATIEVGGEKHIVDKSELS